MSDIESTEKATSKAKKEAKKAEELQELPGFSQGVRVNAALRDVLLGQPVCPNSQIRGKIVNGNYEPPQRGPGLENCQLAGGEWWVSCEAKGHDPYFRKGNLYNTIDVIEEEDGQLVLKGQKTLVTPYRVPNLTSVAKTPRINSNVGPGLKMLRHGYKRLSDLGFKEACQYRGCQKPPTIESQYGQYCGEGHLALIAANEQEEMLRYLGTGLLDEIGEGKVRRIRERQLQDVMPRQITKLDG